MRPGPTGAMSPHRRETPPLPTTRRPPAAHVQADDNDLALIKVDASGPDAAINRGTAGAGPRSRRTISP